MVNNNPKSNLPLNFRTSNSLITTKVPHYTTKVVHGSLVVSGIQTQIGRHKGKLKFYIRYQHPRQTTLCRCCYAGAQLVISM